MTTTNEREDKGFFQAGFAQREYTPEPGLVLQGQFHARIAKEKRDPLMAVALALRQGRQTVVLVALDICVLDEPFIRDCQKKCALTHGIPEEALLFHATHTHVAPAIHPTPIGAGGRTDSAFIDRVSAQVLEAVAAALANLEPVTLHAGTETMEQMGWNRRAMFSNGTSRLYGNSTMPGFCGMEGPRDPELGVLLARDLVGNAKGVILNFSSHPNCLESAYCYSADFPGEARRLVSQALGDIPVLYLTGAAGDTAPSILDPFDPTQPWRGEEGLLRSGRYLAGTALRAIAAATTPMVEPSLGLAQAVLPIAMRTWPLPEDPAYPRPEEQLFIDYYKACRELWPELLASGNPVQVRLNAIRLGDLVLCTNPGELFVESGLEIKRRSRAKVTFIAQLADGYAGYLPTQKAFARGGYEIWPTLDGRCAVGTAERIVEETGTLLAQLGF